ncbi:unnamed protein product [Ranitomeya imitator]|uniref:Uncharacterized protein n=1 Tax=Ranitomeya imitator TaxID=111125 RepID=A0ABN9LMG5_9NEOB|nr:unnamed protein product [Ranitomeya imitator]
MGHHQKRELELRKIQEYEPRATATEWEEQKKDGRRREDKKQMDKERCVLADVHDGNVKKKQVLDLSEQLATLRSIDKPERSLLLSDQMAGKIVEWSFRTMRQPAE